MKTTPLTFHTLTRQERWWLRGTLMMNSIRLPQNGNQVGKSNAESEAFNFTWWGLFVEEGILTREMDGDFSGCKARVDSSFGHWILLYDIGSFLR